jgi:ribosomal protein L29
MATVKKTTKTSAKKGAEIKTIDQLHETLATKITDMLQARRGNAAGELTNPRIITVTRKEIARLKFAIRAHEIQTAKETK